MWEFTLDVYIDLTPILSFAHFARAYTLEIVVTAGFFWLVWRNQRLS
jgi:hypothetical protein